MIKEKKTKIHQNTLVQYYERVQNIVGTFLTVSRQIFCYRPFPSPQKNYCASPCLSPIALSLPYPTLMLYHVYVTILPVKIFPEKIKVPNVGFRNTFKCTIISRVIFYINIGKINIIRKYLTNE